MLRRHLATKEVQEFEYALPIQNKLNYYEIRTNAINDEEVIAVVRNVSERNWAQNELKDKVKELDEKKQTTKTLYPFQYAIGKLCLHCLS